MQSAPVASPALGGPSIDDGSEIAFAGLQVDQRTTESSYTSTDRDPLQYPRHKQLCDAVRDQEQCARTRVYSQGSHNHRPAANVV